MGRCAVVNQSECQDGLRKGTYAEQAAFEVKCDDALVGGLDASSAGGGWRLARCHGRRGDVLVGALSVGLHHQIRNQTCWKCDEMSWDIGVEKTEMLSNSGGRWW